MALLDDLKTFVTTAPNNVFSTSNLFLSKRPPTPDLCGTLYEYPGEEPIQKFGAVGIQFERPRVQLVVRGDIEDYAPARALCQSAIDVMHKIGPSTSMASGRVYLLVLALQSNPFTMGRDDKNRPLVGVNFRFEIER